jgi:hypothetical protein
VLEDIDIVKKCLIKSDVIENVMAALISIQSSTEGEDAAVYMIHKFAFL